MDIRELNDVIPAIQEIIGFFQQQHKHKFARQLQVLLEVSWTTSNEFLEELDGVIHKILANHSDELDRFTIQQLSAVSTIIQDWFRERTKLTVRGVRPSAYSLKKPPSSKPPLSGWLPQRNNVEDP